MKEFKVGIIVAMEKELEQLKQHVSNLSCEHKGANLYYVGTMGEVSVVIQKCGIGKVNAAVGVTEMLNTYRPAVVLSTGVAGSLADNVKPLDSVVGERYAYHDVYCGEGLEPGQVQGLPAVFQADEWLLGVVLKACPIAHHGLIVSGDQFVSDVQPVIDKHPTAIAVDMESVAIAHVCHLYHVPMVSVRVISDSCSEGDYFAFWRVAAQTSFRQLANIIREFK
ncbi:MAG: 5'-methylthioadenosine/adenosylhomocysteine nucleosidase [Prevotella sp.]|nr:5'-methylthioadenosine/adenosylhomocysteine nucleosidase [Prevotella sp.]